MKRATTFLTYAISLVAISAIGSVALPQATHAAGLGSVVTSVVESVAGIAPATAPAPAATSVSVSPASSSVATPAAVSTPATVSAPVSSNAPKAVAPVESAVAPKTTVSKAITMGAAAIINDTFGSPANVQGGTTENSQNIYAQPTTLTLHQTLAWLCLSLALFVIGIVCIRRDAMPFMATYNLPPQFSGNRAAIH